MERRKFARHPLEVPIAFSWRDLQGAVHEGKGHTRDISAAGLFVFARNCPPLESSFQYRASLPKLDALPAPLQMEGWGRVLRVGPTMAANGSSGFAAVIEQYTLEEQPS